MSGIKGIFEKNQSLVTLIIATLVIFYVGSFFGGDTEEIQATAIEGEEEILTLIEEIRSIELDVDFSENLSLYRSFQVAGRQLDPVDNVIIGQSNPFLR